MRKLILSMAFCLLSLSIQAQEQGEVRIQAGGDYKLTIKDYGSHLGFEYFFVDKFSLAPTLTVWFPEIGNSLNLNVDLRYYLTEGVSQLYIVGGYNNYWINTQPGDPGLSINRPGANFGVGALIKATERFGFNTEFKTQSQNTRWPVFRVGAVYLLK